MRRLPASRPGGGGASGGGGDGGVYSSAASCGGLRGKRRSGQRRALCRSRICAGSRAKWQELCEGGSPGVEREHSGYRDLTGGTLRLASSRAFNNSRVTHPVTAGMAV